mmetsp:Transcript_51610/g.129672  ORF Transcript_51610/g.129672 Transcript_51610/m.129672 type:complete len:84 (+) Transcript_51610:415-666(+)
MMHNPPPTHPLSHSGKEREGGEERPASKSSHTHTHAHTYTHTEVARWLAAHLILAWFIDCAAYFFVRGLYVFLYKHTQHEPTF